MIFSTLAARGPFLKTESKKTRRITFANFGPITLVPMVTYNLSVVAFYGQSAARIPGTLFPAMDMLMHVSQSNTPRSSFPVATNRATLTGMC
jgi:hypothetical protein